MGVARPSLALRLVQTSCTELQGILGGFSLTENTIIPRWKIIDNKKKFGIDLGYEIDSLLSIQGLAAPFHTAVPDAGTLHLASPLSLGGTFILLVTGDRLELYPVSVPGSSIEIKEQKHQVSF